MKILLIISVLFLGFKAYCLDYLSACKSLYNDRGAGCIFTETEYKLHNGIRFRQILKIAKQEACEIYEKNKSAVENAVDYEDIPDDVFGYIPNGPSTKDLFKTWYDIVCSVVDIAHNFNDPFLAAYDCINFETLEHYSNIVANYCSEIINNSFDPDVKTGFSINYFKLHIHLEMMSEYFLKDYDICKEKLIERANKRFKHLLQEDDLMAYCLKNVCVKWGRYNNLNYLSSLDFRLYKRKEVSKIHLNGITSICEDSFSDTLEYICIPNSVESIDAETFSHKENLENIFIPEVWNVYIDGHFDKFKDENLYWFVTEKSVFPIVTNANINGMEAKDIQKIDILKIHREKKNCGCVTVDLSSNVFSHCQKLTGTYRIFEKLLQDMYGFITLYIYRYLFNFSNSKINQIGDRCFMYCQGLADLFLYQSDLEIKKIDSGCFRGCIRGLVKVNGEFLSSSLGREVTVKPLNVVSDIYKN